jgi:hypothetical protein
MISAAALVVDSRRNAFTADNSACVFVFVDLQRPRAPNEIGG